MSSMLDALAGPGGPGPGPGPGPLAPPGGPARSPGDWPGPVTEAGTGPTEPAGRHRDVYQNSMQALEVAQHGLQAFMQMDHDAQDRATASRALTIISGLIGGHAADAQRGGGKSLIRALQGA